MAKYLVTVGDHPPIALNDFYDRGAQTGHSADLKDQACRLADWAAEQTHAPARVDYSPYSFMKRMDLVYSTEPKAA